MYFHDPFSLIMMGIHRTILRLNLDAFFRAVEDSRNLVLRGKAL